MPFFNGRGITLAVWLLLLAAVAAQAQPKAYTLHELIDSSKGHLPLLLQKNALVGMAEAGVTDARHTVLPSLKLSDEVTLSSANSLPGTYLPLGTVISTSGSIRPDENWNAASGNIATLYSEYELVNFGLNKARVGAARTQVALGRSDYNRELYLVTSDVARLFFATLQLQYRQRTDSQNMARYEAIYQVIRALAQSGVRAGADSSLALAELAKARITYSQVNAQEEQLRTQLSVYTGIPAGQLGLDTAGVGYARLPLLLNQEASVHETHPLLDYYRQQQNVYRADSRLISKSYLPRILLAGAVWGRASSITNDDRYQDLSAGLSMQRFNYAAGLAFTYNLFDLVHRRDKLSINAYREEASDLAWQQERLILQSQTDQASTRIRATLRNIGQLVIQQQSAQDVYNQKQAQYKAGLVTLIDLTNAAFVLYRSQVDYLEAMGDLYLAGLDKAAATGTLDSFIQSLQ